MYLSDRSSEVYVANSVLVFKRKILRNWHIFFIFTIVINRTSSCLIIEILPLISSPYISLPFINILSTYNIINANWIKSSYRFLKEICRELRQLSNISHSFSKWWQFCRQYRNVVNRVIDTYLIRIHWPKFLRFFGFSS